MTLNHSKTWPVSTLAVVQLRVDPNGRTYSTQFDADLVTDFEIPQQGENELQNEETQNAENIRTSQPRVPNGTSNGCVSLASPTTAAATTTAVIESKNGGVLTLPLSQRHVELFTVQEQTTRDRPTTASFPSNNYDHSHTQQRHPYKTTVRTDTVSTILEQDTDNNDVESITSVPISEDIKLETRNGSKYEKFHVLALAKIEETAEIDRVKTPTVKVENWDLIYTDPSVQNGGRKLCPACTAAAANGQPVTSPMDIYKGRNSPGDYNDRLLVDLPLDARKAATLRRHYYPEGGWGWVIITCTVLVHVLNVGLQLSCSQLAPAGAEKFKTTQVHIAGIIRFSALLAVEAVMARQWQKFPAISYMHLIPVPNHKSAAADRSRYH